MPERGEDEPTEFGRWLIRKMNEHEPKLTRTSLADLVGVSQSTITRWILKQIKPEPGKLELLAEVVDEEYGEVLLRAGYGRPATELPVEPAPKPIDPRARRAGQMLDPASPLSDDDRNRLGIGLEILLERFEPAMRRRVG